MRITVNIDDNLVHDLFTERQEIMLNKGTPTKEQQERLAFINQMLAIHVVAGYRKRLSLNTFSDKIRSLPL